MSGALSAEERAKFDALRVKAENAYEQFALGKSVRAFTDQNGERIELSAATAPRLLATIRQLRTALGLGRYVLDAAAEPRPPIGFLF